MPELPEVEIYRKYFNETSLNKKISEVEILAPKMLKEITPEQFSEKLVGKKFTSSYRHGKYFFAVVNKDLSIAIHFGMTGYLLYFKNEEERTKHIRLMFKFSDGSHLAYDNQRMFGSIHLINDIKEFIRKKDLGPDPISDNLSHIDFKKLLEKKKGAVKPVLMDQSVIAGIGNVYADEILFQTAIHPLREVSTLSDKELKSVYSSMMKIFKLAINKEAERDAFNNSYLLRHRKKNAECPKCGGEIQAKTIGGRTTYFCPKHQL